MTRKNIFFFTCVVLIIMFTIKLLGSDFGLDDIISVNAQSIIDTSDEYTVEGYLSVDEYVVSLEPDSLQPTPVNPEEAKSEPVLEVAEIKATNLEGFEQIYSGVFYKKTGSTALVRVDLTNPNVRFFVNPPNGTMTVCEYVKRYGLQLATNGGGFNMGTGLAGPFAMSDGNVYSYEQKSSITIFISENNKLSFAYDGHTPDGAKYAISGFNRVVQDGKMLDRFYPGHQNYKEGYGYLKRRTSIGISGTWLNIVLFDSPITITEVGEYHLATFPGTEHVYNMDGGGSTNACTDSYGSLVTESGRPVANIFGIYSTPVK